MNVIQMSLSAALIIVVAVIVRALAMYKLPKKTFLALWGVALCRLLIPFSIPAKTSVFGFIAYIRAQIAGSSAAASVSHILPESAVAPAAVIPPVTVVEPAMTVVSPDAVLSWGSPLLLVWLAGTALLGLYFAYLYLKCRREFAASLPAQHAFIPPWQESHPLKRAYSVRVSDRITVPLTYGVFRPVILLPKGLETSDEKQLSYILSHELVHIRRFDALTKLVATAALCVHWFNPLVWVMYILLNRDLEISCDEKVVREWGEAPKSEYALMLVGMAAKKGALSPLYSGFSKYAIEERINAIMKNKQISMIGVVLAVLLVAGTVSVLATSAAGNAQGGANGGAEKVDTAIAWSRSPGGEITEAPYHAPAGMNTWDYLYSLGFLEYDDTTYFQPLYRFNGQWVEAIYDPNIWRGYDYSNFAQHNDVNKRFGEAVGIKVVRNAQTNEITGLVEMTDAEINAARAEGGDKTSGQLTEIPFVTDSAESPIPPIDWETVDPKIKAVIYPDSGDMRKMRLLSVSAEDEPRFSPEDWQIVLLAVEQGLVAWEDGSVLLARINYQKHHDLTQDGALVMTADALVRYQLFTNSTQIAVFLAQDPAEPVTFDLYDSQYAEPIRTFTSGSGGRTHLDGGRMYTFSGLTAARNYYIVATGGAELAVQVTDGRSAAFTAIPEAKDFTFVRALSDADVASAKKAADTYYQALNSFTLFSLELDSGMRCWWWTQHGNDDPDDGADFTPGNLIVFYAYDGKNEMPREITLGRTKAGADWNVINEGY